MDSVDPSPWEPRRGWPGSRDGAPSPLSFVILLGCGGNAAGDYVFHPTLAPNSLQLLAISSGNLEQA